MATFVAPSQRTSDHGQRTNPLLPVTGHEMERLRGHAQILVELDVCCENARRGGGRRKSKVLDAHVKSLVRCLDIRPGEAREVFEDFGGSCFQGGVERRRALRFVKCDGVLRVHIGIEGAGGEHAEGGIRLHNSCPRKRVEWGGEVRMRIGFSWP